MKVLYSKPYLNLGHSGNGISSKLQLKSTLLVLRLYFIIDCRKVSIDPIKIECNLVEQTYLKLNILIFHVEHAQH